MNDLQKTFRAVMDASEWAKDANCLGMDTELFFAGDGTNYDPFAREVCNTCDVMEQCLWYANETSTDDGMFGGMSPRQRRQWRTKNNIKMGQSREEWENPPTNYLVTPINEWSKP